MRRAILYLFPTRGVALIAALCMALCLAVLGETPLAVGLVPSPWDKLLHLLTFGVMALLFSSAVGRHHVLAVLTLVAVLAGMDEIRQIWLPGRQADLQDMLANCVGIGLGGATRIVLSS